MLCVSFCDFGVVGVDVGCKRRGRILECKHCASTGAFLDIVELVIFYHYNIYN